MQPTSRKLFAAGLVGLVLVLIPQSAPLFAQTSTGSDTSSVGARTGSMGTADDTRTVDRRDNGFNPGWLGLAGLAGLLGLMPKKTHPIATTTHRTNDNITR